MSRPVDLPLTQFKAWLLSTNHSDGTARTALSAVRFILGCFGNELPPNGLAARACIQHKSLATIAAYRMGWSQFLWYLQLGGTITVAEHNELRMPRRRAGRHADYDIPPLILDHIYKIMHAPGGAPLNHIARSTWNLVLIQRDSVLLRSPKELPYHYAFEYAKCWVQLAQWAYGFEPGDDSSFFQKLRTQALPLVPVEPASMDAMPAPMLRRKLYNHSIEITGKPPEYGPFAHPNAMKVIEPDD